MTGEGGFLDHLIAALIVGFVVVGLRILTRPAPPVRVGRRVLRRLNEQCEQDRIAVAASAVFDNEQAS